MFGSKPRVAKILRWGAARTPGGRPRSRPIQAPRRTSGPRAA